MTVVVPRFAEDCVHSCMLAYTCDHLLLAVVQDTHEAAGRHTPRTRVLVVDGACYRIAVEISLRGRVKTQLPSRGNQLQLPALAPPHYPHTVQFLLRSLPLAPIPASFRRTDQGT